MRVLVGVCGIGSGHTYRQLPLIEYLGERHQVAVMAYGTSLRVLSEHFVGWDSVRVLEVAVPYLPGTPTGLDFAAAARSTPPGALEVSYRAMDEVLGFLGGLDLVVTDYEPFSAALGYAMDAPVVTLDQQHKYFLKSCPELLAGTSLLDERARLRLFFPKAALRLACSFFTLPASGEGVELIPPVVRSTVYSLVSAPVPKSVLVYCTLRDGVTQSLEELLDVLAGSPDFSFKVVTGESAKAPGNVSLLPHGQDIPRLLSKSEALITTAGHSLLSEAMLLGVPTYLTPIDLYEQQLSARVVADAGFGVSASRVEGGLLRDFLAEREAFRSRVLSDTSVLLRGDGLKEVLSRLEGLVPGICSTNDSSTKRT